MYKGQRRNKKKGVFDALTYNTIDIHVLLKCKKIKKISTFFLVKRNYNSNMTTLQDNKREEYHIAVLFRLSVKCVRTCIVI